MHPSIFSSKDLKKNEISSFIAELKDLANKKEQLKKWQTGIESGRIKSKSETQLQTDFLNLLFGDILDYKYSFENAEWNLEKEVKTNLDGKKPDGVLGYFTTENQIVKAVIELKGYGINLDKNQNRKDFKGSPVEQAFSYAPKMGGACQWVIVSNFDELRLYHHTDMSRYEKFTISELFTNGNFEKFLFLFHKEKLINLNSQSKIDLLFADRQKELKNISNQFYSRYHELRLLLFNHIQKENPTFSPKNLFSFNQKLIDRLIFICFVKDLSIIDDVFRKIKTSVEETFIEENYEIIVWLELKSLFKALDRGFARKNIPPFNGGLFRQDKTFDKLTIQNSYLLNWIDFLNEYDFQSELNVNILGHIFEQSISDLEEIKAYIQQEIPLENLEIENIAIQSVSKRKKDGIFYTPEYITQYIVKKAVGGWLDDRRIEILQEMNLNELLEPQTTDYESIKNGNCNDLIATHRLFWAKYKEKLSHIKVLDPACGSGAFLVEVFDFLYKEWQILENETKKLTTPLAERIKPTGFALNLDAGFSEWKIKKNIIQNNIFGVDLNPESVEISKLSLWLKTANRTESLASLAENIQQGNSLIDDAEIAGEDAFDWNFRFEKIMKNGGFDVVVGNPPYVDIKQLPHKITEAIFKNYKTAENRINLYSIFIEKSNQVLNKTGRLSFVIPNSILVNSSFKKIRELLFDGIDEIVKLPDGVFVDANVETIIFSFGKSKKFDSVKVILFKREDKIEKVSDGNIDFIKKENWLDENLSFRVYLDDTTDEILEKCYKSTTLLGEIADFCLGITPYDSYKGHSKEDIEKKIYHSKTKIDENYQPLITGENIKRFYISEQINEYIKYGNWLGAPRQERFFTDERIIVRQIISGNPPRIYAGFTNKPLFFTQIGFSILLKNESFNIKYLLCLINSKLINFVHSNKFLDLEKQIFQKILIENCKKLPIKNIEIIEQKKFEVLANENIENIKSAQKISSTFLELLISNFPVKSISKKLTEWHKHNFVDLIDEMEKTGTKIPLKQQATWLEEFKERKAEITDIQALIQQTDKEIDSLVYQLYDLTDEEIKIIEK